MSDPRIRVYYTATVTTLDGSDTNAYGEPCEPGQGYTVADGYVDPDWSVFEPEKITRERATFDTVSDSDPDPIGRLVERIHDRIGWVHLDYSEHLYAQHTRTEPGREASLCAHVHGLNDREALALHDRIKAAQTVA